MCIRHFGILHLVCLLAALGLPATGASPFTYQGRLLQSGQPIATTMDLQFSLYSAITGGVQIGSTVTLGNVPVANGLFTVSLDFGEVFDGTARWLAIAVRPGSSTGSYTTLAPRQSINWAPHANFALQAATVSPTALLWRLDGNAGTTTSHFLGTTDTQPLFFRVNNTPALRIEPPSPTHPDMAPCLIGGCSENSMGADAYASTIAGGGNETEPNVINSGFAFIGGGATNTVNGYGACILGGLANASDGMYSFIAGGVNNRAQGQYAFAGGYNNTASTSYAIALGASNSASETCATAIGYNNIASGNCSTAMGSSNTASGSSSTALGSTNTAGGFGAIALGYRNTADADYSCALGQRANTGGHPGAFVWADNSSTTTLTAGTHNQFTIRAAGGVRIFTKADLSTGVSLAGGGSSWNVMSDRNAKAHFAAIDPRSILRKVATLPLTTWNYKAQDPTYRHLGPMAQDFHAAFGLGEGDDRVINTLDLDGVALAAIQGLCRELEARDALIATLREDVAALRRSAAAADARLDALEQQIEGQREKH